MVLSGSNWSILADEQSCFKNQLDDHTQAGHLMVYQLGPPEDQLKTRLDHQIQMLANPHGLSGE